MQYIQERAQDEQTFRRLYLNSYTEKMPGGSDVEYVVDLGQDFTYEELSVDSVTLENKFCNMYQSQKIDFRYFNMIVSFQVGDEPTEDFLYVIKCDRFVDKANFIPWLNHAIAQQNEGLPPMTVELYEPHTYETYTLSLDFTVPDFEGANCVEIQLIGGGWEKLGIQRKVYPVVDPEHVLVIGNSIYDFASPPLILINIQPVYGPGAITNAFGTHSIALQNTSSFGDRIFFTNTERSTCNSIYSIGTRQTVRYLTVQLLSCDEMLLETPTNEEGIMNENDLEMVLVLSLR